jgi:hypothetical protein
MRTVDHTGVSGTGNVAEGIRFEDGSVALRWHGDHASTVVWASLEDAVAVHGHDGSTEVHWLDDEGGDPVDPAVQRAAFVERAANALAGARSVGDVSERAPLQTAEVIQLAEWLMSGNRFDSMRAHVAINQARNEARAAHYDKPF